MSVSTTDASVLCWVGYKCFLNQHMVNSASEGTVLCLLWTLRQPRYCLLKSHILSQLHILYENPAIALCCACHQRLGATKMLK